MNEYLRDSTEDVGVILPREKEDVSFPEPTRLSLFLDGLEYALASSFYRSYANSLGLSGNEKVLDFGGGSGGLSRHLARLLLDGGGRVTCMDISRAWLAVAKKRLKKYPNVEYVHGDVSDAGLEDESFDVIILHLMLHHVEPDARMATVKVLARLLNSDGKLFIREPQKKNHGIPADEVRQMMAAIGLEETESTESKSMLIGPMYYGVFAKTNFK